MGRENYSRYPKIKRFSLGHKVHKHIASKKYRTKWTSKLHFEDFSIEYENWWRRDPGQNTIGSWVLWDFLETEINSTKTCRMLNCHPYITNCHLSPAPMDYKPATEQLTNTRVLNFKSWPAFTNKFFKGISFCLSKRLSLIWSYFLTN